MLATNNQLFHKVIILFISLTVGCLWVAKQHYVQRLCCKQIIVAAVYNLIDVQSQMSYFVMDLNMTLPNKFINVMNCV